MTAASLVAENVLDHVMLPLERKCKHTAQSDEEISKSSRQQLVLLELDCCRLFTKHSICNVQNSTYPHFDLQNQFLSSYD